MFFGDKVLETGIYLPAGDGKAAFTLREDMAEATANILTQDGHENKSYAFSNTENLSVSEIANALSHDLGKAVNYTSPDQSTYKNVLTDAGVPGEYIGVMAGFAEAIKQGELEKQQGDLETILGRRPTSTLSFLKNIYNKN